MPRSFSLFLLLLLVLFAWCPNGQAQGLDPETAEVLFQKGRAAMVAQDYESACQMLQDSFELDPAAGTLMNLAVCEDKRGHLVSSWRRWTEALDLLEASDSRREFVHDQLQSLNDRMAHLTIRVAADAPEGLSISRDGELLKEGELGQDLMADPGAHLVIVTLPGREDQRYHFPLDPGQHRELVVTAGRPVELDAQPGKASAGFFKPRNRKIMGFAALGVGALGAVGAVVTGLLLPHQQDLVDVHCVDKICDDVGAQAASTGSTLFALNTTSWVVAGVGLATGGGMLISLPLTKGQIQGQAPSGSLKVALVGSGLKVAGVF